MTDPSGPPDEQRPSAPPPSVPPAAGPPPGVPGSAPGGPWGPPPGAPRPPAWARPPSPGAGSSFSSVAGDPGAWAALGVLTGVVLLVLGDVVLAADRLSVGSYRGYAEGTLRARFLVFSSWASLDVAVALLLVAALSLAIRPTVPAGFRRSTLGATAVAAVAVAAVAVLRALVTITYGHAFGVGGFVQDLAAVPVAIVAVAIATVAGRPATP